MKCIGEIVLQNIMAKFLDSLGSVMKNMLTEEWVKALSYMQTIMEYIISERIPRLF